MIKVIRLNLVVLTGAVLVSFAALLPAAPPVAFTAGGCSPGLPHASGDFNETIVSGSFTRSYILHVPASYAGSTPTPLVFNFHGFGGNPADLALYNELPQKADTEGFILVSPQGLSTAGTFQPLPH